MKLAELQNLEFLTVVIQLDCHPKGGPEISAIQIQVHRAKSHEIHETFHSVTFYLKEKLTFYYKQEVDFTKYD